MSEETITITRAQFERLKNERVVLFGANNGEWSDEELEANAVAAAVEAAGQFIEASGLANRPLSALDVEQFKALIQQAAWAYMQVYVDYIPF